MKGHPVGGFSFFLHKVFDSLRGSLLPAFVFGISCLFFFGYNPFSEPVLLSFHTAFFVLLFLCASLLFYFNRTRPFFFLLNMLVSYLAINGLKHNYGSIYWSTAQYCYMAAVVPINLTVFYFCRQYRLKTQTNLYVLFALLLEFTIFEMLAKYDISLFAAPTVFGLNDISFCVFAACLVVAFFAVSESHNTRQIYLFFSMLSLFCGFLFSSQPSAVCLFFAAAAAIVFMQIVLDIYNEATFDPSTGVFCANILFKHEQKFFPLKYSVAIMHLDNFEHIASSFSRKKTYKLVKMIVNQVAQNQDISGIYRTDYDEFLLVFYNKDRNSAIASMEEIRRDIASSEFVLKKSKQPVKITISSVVAEKKRSDSGVANVITRAQSIFNQGQKFAQNVTLKA